MGSTYDVFTRDLDGKPVWLTAVEGFDEAKKFMNRLAEDLPGPCFIYSPEKGIVLEAATWADVT